MQTDAAFRLCYVDGPWAWFTTASLGDQWGDDWNDAPYEHNAGAPYSWDVHRECEPYQLRKVAWDGPWETPADQAGMNIQWSVQQINQGCIAWLLPSWHDKADPEPPPVPVGTTLEEFRRIVKGYGGEVYEPAD